MDSSFVSEYIKTLLKTQMTITIVAIQVVAKQFGYQISYKRKQWRQKGKQWLDYLVISTSLMQSYLTSFLLWCSQILNVLCIAKWFLETTRMKNFQRVFWAFSSSIKGFTHYRPVLSIDGTHLYRKYKGTLMIAMERDGNNQLFPLAFTITKWENTGSWSWFLSCIRVGVT